MLSGYVNALNSRDKHAHKPIAPFMQSGDHADDPVMEGYLDLLATDKSKVRSCHGMPASIA